MNKKNIFISSVQKEFQSDRQILCDFILTDPLLRRFFDPFIFEKLPASDITPEKAYTDQVERCNVYLGIFGKEYGYENSNGISPTEVEFDLATALHKTRLIFLTNHKPEERHPKESRLVKKVEKIVVRSQFTDSADLKTAVYAALVNYLEESGNIHSGPFDTSLCKEASISDINQERLKWFVRTAQSKRNFPLSEDDDSNSILSHLHLTKQTGLTNAALLLFGKDTQQFFITAEIRCAMFYGNEVTKPIPAYQVYKGDIFQQVNLAVDFVMSRINLSIGDRSQSVEGATE
jgi:hypothetical protein